MFYNKMSGYLLLLKNMINRILYSIITLFLFSCLEDLPLEVDSRHYMQEDDVNWFYDAINQDLFIQIDLNSIGLDNVNHVYIKDLNNLNSEYYEIFDNGEDGDIIPYNGVYSILLSGATESNYTLSVRLDTYNDNLIQDFQYDINFNSPVIVNDSFYPVIPSEHVLDENEITFFNMVLAIDEPDGRQDIEFVKFYIKKISFFNGSLVNGVCDYTFIEDNDYYWDPTWEMEYIGVNANEQLVYNSEIPMNPIQSDSGCGGFGYVQFKFEVQDSRGFADILEIEEPIQICPGVCE